MSWVSEQQDLRGGRNVSPGSGLLEPSTSEMLTPPPPPPQAPPSSAAGSDDSFRPGSVFRQMADQDEDAAAPSLFKLSWLAGMAK